MGSTHAGAAREEFREHTRLDPDSKQDVLEKWKTYSTLPPEQRKALIGSDPAAQPASAGVGASPDSVPDAGSATSAGSSSPATAP